MFIRSAAIVASLLLATQVLAQEWANETFRDIVASDIGAVVIECPGRFATPDYACLRHSSSVDLVRQLIDLELSSYDDVFATNPWEEGNEGRTASRSWVINVDDPPGYMHAFLLFVADDIWDNRGTMVLFSKLGVFDSSGQQVR